MEDRKALEIIREQADKLQKPLGFDPMTDEEFEDLDEDGVITKMMIPAMQEFAAQQNKELVEKKRALWNKLNEFYEAFGCATDITPELLKSVQQTLNENGK